jgi:hypothetical protein
MITPIGWSVCSSTVRLNSMPGARSVHPLFPVHPKKRLVVPLVAATTPLGEIKWLPVGRVEMRGTRHYTLAMRFAASTFFDSNAPFGGY